MSAPADEDLPPLVVRIPYILNIAGNFPRKRLDVLFGVFARLRHVWPELHLVQHGAQLTEEQHRMTREFGIADQPNLQGSEGAKTMG